MECEVEVLCEGEGETPTSGEAWVAEIGSTIDELQLTRHPTISTGSPTG